jgi:hypothetical protein
VQGWIDRFLALIQSHEEEYLSTVQHWKADVKRQLAALPKEGEKK